MSFARVTGIERRVNGLISSGHCPVFEAVANVPSKKKPQPVYIKFVNDLGIYNELLASVLGNLLELPTAEACLCACPTSLVANQNININCSNDYHLVNASIKEFAIRVQGSPFALGKLEEELLNWRNLPYAAVFDELIINDDRHSQNILKIGANNFKLIDHEQAFTGLDPHNNLSGLFERPTTGNYLASLIFRSGHEITERRLFNAASEISEKMKKITLTNIDELKYLESPVRLNMPGYTQKIEELLKKRAVILQQLLYSQSASEQLFDVKSY